MYGKIARLGNKYTLSEFKTSYFEKEPHGEWLFEVYKEESEQGTDYPDFLQSGISFSPTVKYSTLPEFCCTAGQSLEEIREKLSPFQTIKNMFLAAEKSFSCHSGRPNNELSFFSPVTSPLIMGILNVTPDSFSDGGRFYDLTKAVDYGVKMTDAGTHIIDIGGESTRPGAQRVSLENELERVIPVIAEIKKRRPEAFISIDTTKSEVARKAIEAGALMVNDISAGLFDSRMLDTVAEMGVPIVLMHIQNTPETMQNAPYYHSVTREVFHFLNERIRTAQDKGIKTVIADVGIGFGKSLEHNSELLSRLDEFKCLSVPLLIGVSRKSLIGKATGLQVQERDAMTCVLEFNAMQKGAAIIRTHNYHNALNLIKIFEFVE